MLAVQSLVGALRYQDAGSDDVCFPINTPRCVFPFAEDKTVDNCWKSMTSARSSSTSTLMIRAACANTTNPLGPKTS